LLSTQFNYQYRIISCSLEIWSNVFKKRTLYARILAHSFSYRNATFRGKQNLHTVVLILVNYVSSQKLLVEHYFTVSAHRTTRCRRDSSLNITLPHRNSWCNSTSLFCKFLGWSSGIVHKYFPYSIDSIKVKFSAMFTWEYRQIPAIPARLRLTVSYQFPLWILSPNRITNNEMLWSDASNRRTIVLLSRGVELQPNSGIVLTK